MNIALIYLYRIIYGVCIFNLIVRYSLAPFVIQIVKEMNIKLIHLYSILYKVCLYPITVCYSVPQFVI